MICVKVSDLRINHKAREWCRLPYPGHKLGCPNFNHSQRCPPSAPLIEDYFDLTKPVYLVAVRFNLAEHVSRMLSLHPGWSDRQARCVLYWQSKVNRELEDAAKEFSVRLGEELTYTTCPEAMGVNVIATAQKIGIPVKVKPRDYVYKMALIGSRRP